MVSLVLTIDDFVLRVYSENGSADSKGYIGGSKWKCEARNDQTPIKKTYLITSVESESKYNHASRSQQAKTPCIDMH
ncbi:hypothetical protein N7450_001273 [Penicillium hetheringtonii]|uniref:Uncharacterized protein n=1 Tax=Penicillium hetheringtonii TaxID=911720 RepID=A0AAD6E4B8_9EURO|nr:hypothetical protein N7450_001273 [Penicillium hetheringtonii]